MTTFILIFLITECLFLIMVRPGEKDKLCYFYLGPIFQPQRLPEGGDTGGQRTQDFEDYEFEFESPSRERVKNLLKDRASLIFEAILFNIYLSSYSSITETSKVAGGI